MAAKKVGGAYRGKHVDYVTFEIHVIFRHTREILVAQDRRRNTTSFPLILRNMTTYIYVMPS